MRDYTDEYVRQMNEAFTAVQDKTNWKLPIDAVIPADADRKLIADAIIFYAGSPCEFITEADGVHVVAAGYYACIGA